MATMASSLGLPPAGPSGTFRGSALRSKDPNVSRGDKPPSSGVDIIAADDADAPMASSMDRGLIAAESCSTPKASPSSVPAASSTAIAVGGGAAASDGPRRPPPGGRSGSPEPRDPVQVATTLGAAGAVTPSKSTRQSFNEASRPNASIGRAKPLTHAGKLRPPPAAEFKVVLVGSSNAGKTCLAYRYVCGGFRQASCPTVGAAFNCVYEDVARPTTPGGGGGGFFNRSASRAQSAATTAASGVGANGGPIKDSVKIGLWDTAGQEQFAELVPLYFRDAHAVIFVADSTRRDALEDLERWIVRVNNSAPPHVLRYLALSKCDRPEDERWVLLDDAIEFAEREAAGGVGVMPSALSPGRGSIATSYVIDDGHGVNNNSLYGGRAVSVAGSVATTAVSKGRGGAGQKPLQVFEVSSRTGDGVADLFATLAADAYRRHTAEAAAKASRDTARAAAGRVQPGAATATGGAKGKGGQGQKRDRRCC